MRKSVLLVMGMVTMLSALAADELVAVRKIECDGFAGGVPVEVEAELLRTFKGFAKLKIKIGERTFAMPRTVLALLEACDIATMKLTFEEVGKATVVAVHFCSPDDCVAVRVNSATRACVVERLSKESAPRRTELLKTDILEKK